MNRITHVIQLSLIFQFLVQLQFAQSPCPTLSISSTVSGNSTNLSASAGFTSYSWSPSTGLSNPYIQNPVASPGSTATYTCTAISYGPNLMSNPDFSSGYNGFTSGMNNNPVYSPCNYYVGPDWFGAYPQLTDHTSSTDNMYMSIDGCTSPTVIWQQTISGLQQNTVYDFSFWASRADLVQPTLEIHFIDNSGNNTVATLIGIPYTGTWTWDNYAAPLWNSGTNTSVTIQIINLQSNSAGNDFGLDDFEFKRVCQVSSTVTVFSACPAITITSAANTVNGTVQLNASAGYSDYIWTPATGLSNPNIPNPVATPTVTTTYTCFASNPGNLIVNPDFSLGNSGFTSGMNYAPFSYSPCNYSVGPNWFGSYPQLTDHTATTDNMYMAVDGCTSPTLLWEQTIFNLQPNTNYDFSFWASKADQVQPIFEIHFIDNNGNNILGTVNGIPYSGTWSWDQYSVPAWNSGTNTSVTIQVINLQSSGTGNDFGLDDFSFVNNCNATATVVVTYPVDIACSLNTVTNTTLITCQYGSDGTASAVITPASSLTTYLWLPGAQTAATAIGLSAGSYTVVVTDSAGCKDTAFVTLLDPPPINADFSTSEVEDGLINSTVFFFNETDNATSWSWSFGDTDSSYLQNPSHVFSEEGSFIVTLIVADSSGCVDTVSKYFNVVDEFTFYAPNAFTPGDDGVNEAFLPRGVGWDLENYELRIYDRWGEEIYFTHDAIAGWNGKTMKNRDFVQEEVYVWKVRLRDTKAKLHEYIGHVTVLR
jgi:gliding motility-associated-like protein